MTQDKVLYFSRVAAERGWYHEVFKKLLKKLHFYPQFFIFRQARVSAGFERIAEHEHRTNLEQLIKS